MGLDLKIEELAEGLKKSRDANGVCPSQRTGTEVDGHESKYCPLDAMPCEHKGNARCYDDGNFHLLNFNECKYEGK